MERPNGLIDHLEAKDQSIKKQPNQVLIKAQSQDVPLETIKAILDRGMAKVSALYVGHQTITAPNGFTTISFLYFQGTSALTLNEVVKVATMAIKQREALRHDLAAARSSGNNAMFSAAAKRIVEADKAVVRESEFITIETSQVTNSPPIIMYQRGLPDWVAYREHALELASEKLSGALNIIEVNRSVPGAKEIVTCQNDQGANVYVDPRLGAVYTRMELVPSELPLRQHSAGAEAERQARITAQWGEFMTTGVNVRQFELGKQ